MDKTIQNETLTELRSHERFHSSNGKRLVLIAEDEMINRELLANLLYEDYELIEACDGGEAYEKIVEYHSTLSLVLLDLFMPIMNGLDILKKAKSDPELKNLPIIVLTSDQKSEVESLTLGASDFIPKPYPQPDVIRARIRRTIELAEDRQIIQSTERDALTNLFNREFFYRYAEQYDKHHPDIQTDAIVLDIYHFHMINERFGTEYGNDILKKIAFKLREMMENPDGIVCRREADTFLVYCPHIEDHSAFFEEISSELENEDQENNRIRIRIGVYENVDKELDIERRFDRAQMALDNIRNSFSTSIGIYDNSLHDKELFAEQLIEIFPKAIEEKQFKVFFQPKFDVRPKEPILASAEALVRWMHPTLGMISPGVFIPLFEANGLVLALDHYVWRETAAQLREWKDRLGVSVPVAVNVSRVDLYDPSLMENLTSLIKEFGLTTNDLLLEITESAYTQDSDQIIESVNKLREIGFHIEMDDFGTGYSSLNMISTLQIDALKLDMQFIRTAFSKRKDTRLLEVIIELADYLSVPVIAEGVETEEQLFALKAMGCDMVQGYYFSKPIPAVDFERFIIERKERTKETSSLPSGSGEHKEMAFGRVAHALSSDFESIYYVDSESDHYVEFSSSGKYEDLMIEQSGADFFADTAKNIPRVVYEADREKVSHAMKKQTMLENRAVIRSR